MRILFFVDRLLRGGIQTLLLNLTIQLKKNDSQIVIDYLNFDDGNHYELEDVMESMGCNVYKVVMPHLNTLQKTLAGLDSFFKEHHDYDIIHAHCSSKGVLPLYYAKKYGIRNRIVHSHNTKFQSQNPLTICVGNMLKAPLCRIATDYFACGELAGKWLFDNIFTQKNIKVKILNNGIILDNFIFNQKERNQIRNEFCIGNSTKVIGNVGRFSTQKNHSFMIQLFDEFHKLVPDSKLLLVGEGELMERAKCQVSNLNISDSVIFAGFRNDTNKFYQAFDLFLMPSLYEGLPFVGIEAQASGLPCLFSDTVTKEVAVLDSTQFASLNDSPAYWAQIMKKLIECTERKDTSNEMSSAGYNIELETKKLFEYYQSLLNYDK